ncbi:MAG: hypothetical protein KJP16_15205 [Gammaproteobacteria bacterium]|nr:hypothetical protein [Gammaproteobacteria bacterium]NNL52151.1 hypothetical protein [Woeseiaceae bacterium]
MANGKNMRWVDSYGTEAEPDSKADGVTLGDVEPAANDADGWKQYRRWISKAPAPRGRRSSIDPALYTWKGYRDWSDQVKRNWIKDSDKD